jgi:hypothetical protein
MAGEHSAGQCDAGRLAVDRSRRILGAYNVLVQYERAETSSLAAGLNVDHLIMPSYFALLHAEHIVNTFVSKAVNFLQCC